jgi:hypothetical protein
MWMALKVAGRQMSVTLSRRPAGHGTGVWTNARPTAIDRADRRAMGVWYVDIAVGPVLCELTGTVRPARQDVRR